MDENSKKYRNSRKSQKALEEELESFVRQSFDKKNENINYSTFEQMELIFRLANIQVLRKIVAVLQSLLNLLNLLNSDHNPIKVMPPGGVALKLLKLVFSKKAFSAIFSQDMIDMREEYFEALAEGKDWKAKWIVVRYHLCLALVVSSYISSTIAKKFVEIWKIIP